MRQFWILVALGGTGCNQLLGVGDPTRIDGGGDSGAVTDARPDAAIDAPGEACFGSLGPACFVVLDAGPVMLTTDIDTSNAMTEPRCKPVALTNGIEACAIVGTTITIGQITVTGSRPLMVVASMALTVEGDVDIGSVLNTRRGPGANPMTECSTAPSGGAAGGDAAGGGAGGSFGIIGANGGDSSESNNGGNAVSNGLGIGLHGGCPGGAGGVAANGSETGPGGYGGGAIYLVAGQSITISKAIRTSGGGGSGGSGRGAGGGGGGSGGMIALESQNIILTGGSAELAANGGGGGEGTLDGLTTDGSDGGQSTAYNQVGAGSGNDITGGGNGGAGARLGVPPVDGATGTRVNQGQNDYKAAGGGGGGASGLIWYKGSALVGDLSKISPLPTQGT